MVRVRHCKASFLSPSIPCWRSYCLCWWLPGWGHLSDAMFSHATGAVKHPAPATACAKSL
jgi:hypothetical protein